MPEDLIYDYIIVGGGIIGAACAYKLSLTKENSKILLIEKESQPASHQTGNNSGVIHSGIYYKPNSYKAKNCVNGRRQLVKFAKDNKINIDICGKLIVASNKSEIPYLEKIYTTGTINKIEGIRKINAQEAKEIEPFVKAIKAVYVPCTGIIDFTQTTKTFINLFLSKNTTNTSIFLQKVVSVEQSDNYSQVYTKNNKTFRAKNTIFCGGLQSDLLALKDKIKIEKKIVPFRGDYYKLTERAKHKVRNLIYPVPNDKFPFLGVHFTRMINKDIECGPNAVFSFKREGYKKTDFNIKDTLDALSYKGTWKLFFNHTKFALNEYKRAFSKKLFLETLQKLIPTLEMEDITPHRSGVRAMLLSPDGTTHDDFKIIKNGRNIHVLNAPSPAATACMAIADEILNQL